MVMMMMVIVMDVCGGDDGAGDGVLVHFVNVLDASHISRAEYEEDGFTVVHRKTF